PSSAARASSSRDSASGATLRVHDCSGRLLFEQAGRYEAGMHSVTLNRTQIGSSGGLYFCSLNTAQGTFIQKLVLK
ncbi:MAG TPA: T9SS type A sorting domain-containing protein, partial [Saprospiraceae bacterium]|nr:T9SS type A sorting domain-containing protein [Saprospiraceae bacterium]